MTVLMKLLKVLVYLNLLWTNSYLYSTLLGLESLSRTRIDPWDWQPDTGKATGGTMMITNSGSCAWNHLISWAPSLTTLVGHNGVSGETAQPVTSCVGHQKVVCVWDPNKCILGAASNHKKLFICGQPYWTSLQESTAYRRPCYCLSLMTSNIQ